MKIINSVVIAMVFAMTLGLSACDDGKAENFGEKVDDAADNVKDKAEEVGDAVKDATN